MAREAEVGAFHPALFACGSPMSTVDEIEAAIEKLSPMEQSKVADWLNSRLVQESPALLAAIDEADHSLAEEGGVALEDARKNLRQWITA